MAFIKYFHLLTLIVWLGGMIFFSFIAAPAIFKSLPRETAGDVVGIIFPKYFIIGYAATITLVATLAAIGWGRLAELRVPLALLLVLTGLTVISGAVIGSKARAIKTEIRTLEAGPAKESLVQKFKKLHGVSMMFNVTIMILGLVYVAYLPVVLRF